MRLFGFRSREIPSLADVSSVVHKPPEGGFYSSYGMCTIHERIRWLVGHRTHIRLTTDMKCSRLFEFGGLLICITAAHRVLVLYLSVPSFVMMKYRCHLRGIFIALSRRGGSSPHREIRRKYFRLVCTPANQYEQTLAGGT